MRYKGFDLRGLLQKQDMVMSSCSLKALELPSANTISLLRVRVK